MNRLLCAYAVGAVALLAGCVQKESRIGRQNPFDPAGPNYQGPTITASPDKAVVNVGDTVTITAAAHDPNGTVIAFFWALDGVNFTQSMDSTAAVSYASAGEKRVCVRAMDNDSLLSIVDTVVIRVKEPLHLESGLVLYLPFSGNANDESGNSNRTTVHGASLTSNRFATAGSAYSFGGSDYIEVADTVLISFANTQSFCVSLWLKTSSSQANMLPLSKYQSGGFGGYFFDINSTAAGYCGGAGIASFIVATGSPACVATPINDDAWHHLVGAYTAADSSATLYLDNVAQSKTGTRTHDVAVAAPLRVGGLAGVYPYLGAIDDIRIYNRLLTAAEIDSLYHEGGWTGK
jgi:hypothetical protein